MSKKYCAYMEQDVIISGFNNDGKCRCLKCRKKQCETECRAAKSARSRVFAQEYLFNYICLCNECLNATFYGKNRGTR